LNELATFTAQNKTGQEKGNMPRLLKTVKMAVLMASFALLPVRSTAAPNLEPPRRAEFPILGSGKILLMTLTGKLLKVPNDRGESTGWVIELDRNVRFEGQRLPRIEIDPLTEEIGQFVEKRVEIKGRPAWMEGNPERGFFPIIELSAIQELAS
jgi:hypothetical protein